MAVQAYQTRAFYVIDWLDKLAKRDNRVINVRLVKGAYWDSEIKLAQELGVPNYPVFTRKSLTDLSWMASAKKLFSLQKTIFEPVPHGPIMYPSLDITIVAASILTPS